VAASRSADGRRPSGAGGRAAGAVRGGTRRLAEEEEVTLGVPVATVAHGNGGTGPPAMAAGWQWLVTSRRRLGSGCWAPGSWSMKRWRAGQGGGTGGRASKEAALAAGRGRSHRRRCVCKRLGGERKWGWA
jgi:hypothetical protein